MGVPAGGHAGPELLLAPDSVAGDHVVDRRGRIALMAEVTLPRPPTPPLTLRCQQCSPLSAPTVALRSVRS